MCLSLLINNVSLKNPSEENLKISSENIELENTIEENYLNNESGEQINNIAENESIPTESKENNVQEVDWYIEIPAIDLKAPIMESTNMEILDNYVGHFEETQKTEGNIGLAGHNRGYTKNYFENLNKLKIGEEIKYKYYEFEKSYFIEKIEIINNTDWSYLENSDRNKITLITCVENEPDLRLCVQATEKL